jgi:ubiquinone biosynthesis protein UbiJ
MRNPFTLILNTCLPVIIAGVQRLDNQCWDLLAPHANKIISFHIEQFPPLYFEIQEQGLILLDNISDNNPNKIADTTFTGPLSAFISMIFTKHHTPNIKNNLHVKGDIECAKALYDSWHHLELDWEGEAAKIIGDNAAHLMCKTLQHGKNWLRDVYQARTQDMGAYLQDEIGLLPSQLEIEALYHEIDTLTHDVDRFEAKLRLWQAAMANRDAS